MLTSLIIRIKPMREGERITHHYGSLFHGALMDRIEGEYAAKLHKSGLKPYSQYVAYDYSQKNYKWIINTLEKEAKEKIAERILNFPDEYIYIQHKQSKMEVIEKKLERTTTYLELSNEYFLQKDPQRKVKIKFLTPTSFKVADEYQIFPSVTHLYKSVFNKWNSFYEDVSLDDEQVLEHLITHTRLIGYDLRSARFYLENAKIPSFTGDIFLYIAGPESLVRVANLLFALAEYSGVGVKTSLGMGGIKFE